MTTYIKTELDLPSKPEAYARMVCETGHNGETETQFIVTIGDYIIAKWHIGKPMTFENRSAEGYASTHPLCLITEATMRHYVIPTLLAKLNPSSYDK